MTESEFNQAAEAIFALIENACDQCEADIDCNLNGGVLEIEFSNNTKLIINRHAPNREIWLAAKSGAFHFSWQNAQWFSQRDGRELFHTLNELFLATCGMPLFLD